MLCFLTTKSYNAVLDSLQTVCLLPDSFPSSAPLHHLLCRTQALPLKQRLRCLLTAVEILRGQAEALNIDRKDFYIQLYAALLQVYLFLSLIILR